MEKFGSLEVRNAEFGDSYDVLRQEGEGRMNESWRKEIVAACDDALKSAFAVKIGEGDRVVDLDEYKSLMIDNRSDFTEFTEIHLDYDLRIKKEHEEKICNLLKNEESTIANRILSNGYTNISTLDSTYFMPISEIIIKLVRFCMLEGSDKGVEIFFNFIEQGHQMNLSGYRVCKVAGAQIEMENKFSLGNGVWITSFSSVEKILDPREILARRRSREYDAHHAFGIYNLHDVMIGEDVKWGPFILDKNASEAKYRYAHDGHVDLKTIIVIISIFSRIYLEDLSIRYAVDPSIADCFYIWTSSETGRGGIFTNVTRASELPKINTQNLIRSRHFINCYRNLNDQVKHKLHVPMNRIRKSLQSRDLSDRLIDLFIALESMLLDAQSELSYRLAINAAQFLGRDDAERNRIFNIVREGYKVRSMFVHGKEKYFPESRIPHGSSEFKPSSDRFADTIDPQVVKIFQDIFIISENVLIKIIESGKFPDFTKTTPWTFTAPSS